MRQTSTRNLLLLGLALAGCAGTGGTRGKQGAAAEAKGTAPVAPGTTSAGAPPAEPDTLSIASFVLDEGGVMGCYEKVFRYTKATGKTVVQFAVLPDGSVAGAQVLETTLGDDATTACVVERLSKLKTPFRPSAPKAIRMPFTIR